MKMVFVFVLLTISTHAFAQSSRKTVWTVAEVKGWMDSNKKYSLWKGWLLYQGSDSFFHHFTYRIMDSWAFFHIKTGALNIQDVRRYNTSSSGRLGYYYVDVERGFVKAKDY